MKDLFLLEKKLGRKKEKLGRFKKLKKLLIGKVERDEKKKADELVK
jgi:hypothetical protein